MKKNSLQSYKVQYRLKSELKTMNRIPLSPLRMSSLVVVHCTESFFLCWLYRSGCFIVPSNFPGQNYCFLLPKIPHEKKDSVLRTNIPWVLTSSTASKHFLKPSIWLGLFCMSETALFVVQWEEINTLYWKCYIDRAISSRSPILFWR